MINAVLVDLPEHNARVRRIKRVFNDACWALDVEPEFVDVTSYDSRATKLRRYRPCTCSTTLTRTAHRLLSIGARSTLRTSRGLSSAD